MSWNNTVRCGHCGESGHNRASCTALREQNERWLNSDNGWERRIAERYFAKKKHKAERSRNRSCSYCQQSGHTKRTCKIRKADIDVYADIIYSGREKLYKSFHEKGFGIGTLVSYLANEWCDEKRDYFDKMYLGVVTKIDFDALTHEFSIQSSASNGNHRVVQITWLNHKKGIAPGVGVLPLRVLDTGNQYSDEYDAKAVDWRYSEAARVKIVTPLEAEDAGLPPCLPSLLSCHKLADARLAESGKERWRMPRDLQTELEERGIKV